jgi:hypothetical protein
MRVEDSRITKREMGAANQSDDIRKLVNEMVANFKRNF